MRKGKTLKRMLSILLSFTMVISLVTVTKKDTKASSSSTVISEDFETVSGDWKDNSDSANPVAVKAQETVAVMETVDLITNGDFENTGFDYTSLWGSNAGSLGVVTESDNRVLKAETFANENILYVQSGMTPGETYKIRFKIKGSNNISYHLFCGDTGLSSAAVIQDWQTAMTEWTTYEKTYTVPEGNAGHLVIQNVTGSGSGDLYIDDFSVSLSKTAYTYSEGIGNCDGAEPDKVLVMENMTKVSQSLHLESGKSYQFSFKVKGEDGADATVTLATDATDVEVATPTSQWQDVSGTFTVESETHTISLKRQGTGKVFIDDVVIKEAESEEMEQVEISFDKYEGGWYFTVDDISKIAGGCYRIPVKIDGNTTTDIIIEYPQSWYPNGLAVWSFTNFGGTTPETSFEIAENAIMTPCDGITGSIDTSRKAVMVTNQLKVIKKDGVWMESASAENQEETVIAIGECAFNNGDVFSAKITNLDAVKATRWYSAISTENSRTWGQVTGTIEADGEEQTMVVAFPGNGEVFFYLDGANKTLLISKNMKFSSANGKYIIQFTKNYEIDLVNNLVFEQGKRPVEKKAVNLKLGFDRLVNESFMFSYELFNGQRPQAGYYRTEAVIDGKETQVLMEYYPNDDAFFIYPNCFNATPVDGKEGYPAKRFELKKGAVLTPIIVGTWSKNVNGQPYQLSEGVSIVKDGTTWMDVDYFEYIKNAEPLNVKIVFERVKGRAAIMRVVTPDGQSIDSIYGDWTTARGNILRGIMNTATGAYTYENELAAYSITGNTFYIDGLRLNELDGLQIDAGTILYPDSTCKSNIPIKIVNQLRIIRDENDEWQVDKSFTTDYDLVDVNAASNGTQGNSDSSESSDEADKKNDDTKLSGTDKEDNSYNLSNILFHSDSKDVLPTSGKTVSTYIWVIILIAVIVPAAGVGLFVFKDRKKKIKQED